MVPMVALTSLFAGALLEEFVEIADNKKQPRRSWHVR